MKRFSLNRRDTIYNQIDTSELMVVGRLPVAPGQTLDAQLMLDWKTDPCNIPILNPLQVHLAAYYVPFRLLWDDWTGFISQDGGSYTFPTNTTQWKAVLDMNHLKSPNNVYSSMARRAYKLVYNEFYGDKDNTSVGGKNFYDDITLDTDVSIKTMINLEQFSQCGRHSSGVDEPTFDATTVPINLHEFQQAMSQANRKRQLQASGDKYVDTLRYMGVEPDWRIQNAPELLVKRSKMFKPQLRSSTEKVTLGQMVSVYQGELEAMFRGKRFGEHGIVLVVAACRVVVANAQYPAPLDNEMITVEDFWTGQRDASWREINEELVSSAVADTFFVPQFAFYNKGQDFAPTSFPTGDYYLAMAPQTFEDSQYLNPAFPGTGEIGHDFAAQCRMKWGGSTPVPQDQV